MSRPELVERRGKRALYLDPVPNYVSMGESMNSDDTPKFCTSLCQPLQRRWRNTAVTPREKAACGAAGKQRFLSLQAREVLAATGFKDLTIENDKTMPAKVGSAIQWRMARESEAAQEAGLDPAKLLTEGKAV